MSGTNYPKSLCFKEHTNDYISNKLHKNSIRNQKLNKNNILKVKEKAQKIEYWVCEVLRRNEPLFLWAWWRSVRLRGRWHRHGNRAKWERGLWCRVGREQRLLLPLEPRSNRNQKWENGGVRISEPCFCSNRLEVLLLQWNVSSILFGQGVRWIEKSKAPTSAKGD